MYYFSPKRYEKNEDFDPFYNQVNYSFAARARFIPTLSFIVGITIIVTQIFIPMYFFTTTSDISSPIAGSVLGIASGFSSFSFDELQSATNNTYEGNVPASFKLTIPKLGIKDAVVETNSTNMSPDDFVGHYRGSALPGEKGNAFLYGHSVLPVFYNPKNYKTIFSTLNKLDTGDTFSIKYNNKEYTYKIDGVEIVPTEDVKPLGKTKPAYLNESTMVLMTCWPPGLKTNRLQVHASLVE